MQEKQQRGRKKEKIRDRGHGRICRNHCNRPQWRVDDTVDVLAVTSPPEQTEESRRILNGRGKWVCDYLNEPHDRRETVLSSVERWVHTSNGILARSIQFTHEDEYSLVTPPISCSVAYTLVSHSAPATRSRMRGLLVGVRERDRER